jgi:hypothetical protein
MKYAKIGRQSNKNPHLSTPTPHTGVESNMKRERAEKRAKEEKNMCQRLETQVKPQKNCTHACSTPLLWCFKALYWIYGPLFGKIYRRVKYEHVFFVSRWEYCKTSYACPCCSEIKRKMISTQYSNIRLFHSHTHIHTIWQPYSLNLTQEEWNRTTWREFSSIDPSKPKVFIYIANKSHILCNAPPSITHTHTLTHTLTLSLSLSLSHTHTHTHSMWHLGLRLYYYGCVEALSRSYSSTIQAL